MSGLALRETPAAQVDRPRLDVERLLGTYLAPAREIQANRAVLELGRTTNTLPTERAQEFRERALRRYRDIPPPAELARLEALFWDAATVPAEEPVKRLLLGAMLDGLRSKPSDGTSTYIDLLVMMLADDFEDFDQPVYVEHRASAPVIAWAVRRVLRTEKFPPDIADFLAMCREIEWKFRSAASTVRKLIELRDNAEDILLITGDLKGDADGGPF